MSRIALTWAAISRRVRSASAVRREGRARRRRARSMSRALVMAMAAWLARARMRSASVVVEGVAADGVDLDDAERAVVAGDRRRDHRVEARCARRTRSTRGSAGTARPRSSPAMTTRSSATATPVAPTPTEIHSLARSSSVNRRASAVVERPAQLAGPGSRRSRMAPWPPTSRLASSTTCWRISAGSRSAVMRAAISRRACSASARRASASRERSSSSSSRVAGDGDGGLGGDRLEEPGVGLAPGVGAAGEDRQRPERAGLADERRGHDRADARRRRRSVSAPRAVREPLVVAVVAGPERSGR